VRHRVGTGRVAARAHRGGDEQLLGSQIAHAARESSAVGALVIGVVRAPLGRREVALPRRPYDTPSDLWLARSAVALASVTETADHEEEAAVAAENQPEVVQVPTPNDALLALLRVISDGPPVCVPTRQGRSRASLLGLLPFVPSVRADYATAAVGRTFRRTPGPLPTERRGRSHAPSAAGATRAPAAARPAACVAPATRPRRCSLRRGHLAPAAAGAHQHQRDEPSPRPWAVETVRARRDPHAARPIPQVRARCRNPESLVRHR